MAYHPRIECSDISSMQTTRTCNSALWFVNCPELEQAILGYAGRYITRYEVKLYALAIEGSHKHQLNLFPKANRAAYMRDFNSSVARAVRRHQKNYPGGRLFARRYSAEYLIGDEDMEDRFFYIVLQPVNDRLVDDIKDYPGYNCFEDAITGTERKYKVVNWKEYNDAKRWRKDVSIEEYTEIVTLKYDRLPGYEHLSQADYEAMMRRKLAERTAKLLKEHKDRPCLGAKRLRKVKPGSLPVSPKTSGPKDHRPRVSAKNPEHRSRGEAWYFGTYFKYKECSKRYRAGDLTVQFPPGTYKPPLFTVAFCGPIP